MRLRTDASGNTLSMAAAAMFPLAAMIGSGLDMSRTYLVKARLQSACDAGVLAARKTMIAPGTLDDAAAAAGQSYFTNNFPTGTYGVTGQTFTPSLVGSSPNEVQGVATVTVPMSLMTLFGFNTLNLTATCTARFDTADTDVMFVLDNTGSMACQPNQPDSCGQPIVTYTRPDNTTGYHVQENNSDSSNPSRIADLRSAVLTFYDTVAGSVDSSTHVRYGFVPYTSTVNAGLAVTQVSPSYMVGGSSGGSKTWTYDSRKVVGDHNQGSAVALGPYTNVSQSTCSSYNGLRTPTTGYNTDGTAISYATSWTAANNGTCSVSQQTLTPVWRYTQVPFDVSQFVQFQSVTDPSKITGETTKWQGCLEERDTQPLSTFDQSALPADLDPDLIPTSDATRWRPMWPDVIYARTNANSVDDYGTSTNPYGDGPSDGSSYLYGSYSSGFLASANSLFSKMGSPNNYGKGGLLQCGQAVQRLATLSRSDVSKYLNAPDFVPQGGTYHDTGMIWGTRMLSPNGIFAGDTAAWPNRPAPNRYIVFMTDGHMATQPYIYGMYGLENYDKRTTAGNFANSDNLHNARFLAECQAAKGRNITVFVVSVATAPDANLNACASSGTAYFASDATSLTNAFATIAKQVALLRLSK